MPQIVVDFSNVEEFELLPVGLYEVEIKEVQPKQSQGGEAMLAVQLEVIDGEYQGRTLFTNLMLEGRGLGITKQAFKCLGIPAGQLDTDDMIGAAGTVRVIQRVWKVEDDGDGQPRNRISAWIDPDKM